MHVSSKLHMIWNPTSRNNTIYAWSGGIKEDNLVQIEGGRFQKKKIPTPIQQGDITEKEECMGTSMKSWLEYWDIEEEECHQDRKALNQHIGDYYRGEVWRKGEQRKKYYIDQFNPIGPG